MRTRGGRRLQEDTRLDAWIAMFSALHPEYIHTQQMKLVIECRSPLSRGAVLADLRAKPSVGIDTKVALTVELELFGRWLQSLAGREGELR